MRKRIVTLLICIVSLMAFMAPAFAATSEDLDAAVQRIKDAQYKVDQTKTSITDIESEIKKSEESIATINGIIDELNTQIAALDEKMAGTKAEIAAAEEKRAQQEADLEERIRVMYMYGDEGYMEMLFSAKDFTELLTRVDMVKNVMSADKDRVNALEATKKEIEAKNADLEADKAEVVTAQKAQSDAKASQESAKAQQDQLLAQNQDVLAKQQAALDAEVATGNELAQALGLTSVNGIIQTGDYYWPIDPSNAKAFYISDVFGNRPVGATNGVGSTNHQGIDITPGNGEPIMAIADGTVLTAGEYGGYGNAVVLDHGVDTSGTKIGSIYGHMSSVAATVGATVKKGDVIGYVGSTGNSTGPHLHLSITENGTFVDPMNYFPQYANSYVYVD